jgi:hypothetical protein
MGDVQPHLGFLLQISLHLGTQKMEDLSGNKSQAGTGMSSFKDHPTATTHPPKSFVACPPALPGRVYSVHPTSSSQMIQRA